MDADGVERAAARLPQHLAAAARRPHPAGRQRPARRLADGQRDDAPRSSRRRTCTRARGPTITSAPGTMQYGGTIDVETPDAARIAKVSLVRIGSVTHNFNMDQRWQELSFRQVGGDARDRRADVGQRRASRRLLRVPARRQGRAVEGRDPEHPDAGGPGHVAPSVPGRVGDGRARPRVAELDRVDRQRRRRALRRASLDDAGFTPSAATRIATVTGHELRRHGSRRDLLLPRDRRGQAGNASAPSAEASARRWPTRRRRRCGDGAGGGRDGARHRVGDGDASDDVGVAGVQFRLDGADLGAEDTSAPVLGRLGHHDRHRRARTR